MKKCCFGAHTLNKTCCKISLNRKNRRMKEMDQRSCEQSESTIAWKFFSFFIFRCHALDFVSTRDKKKNRFVWLNCCANNFGTLQQTETVARRSSNSDDDDDWRDDLFHIFASLQFVIVCRWNRIDANVCCWKYQLKILFKIYWVWTKT